MPGDNLSIVLNSRPKAEIIPGETFHEKVSPAPKAEDLKDGEVLLETLYLSLDPAMRGWLAGECLPLPPFPVSQSRYLNISASSSLVIPPCLSASLT